MLVVTSNEWIKLESLELQKTSIAKRSVKYRQVTQI